MRLSHGIKHQISQPHKSFFYIYIFFEPDYSDLAYGTRNIHSELSCVLERFSCLDFLTLFLALLLFCHPFYTRDIDMWIFIYN